MPYSDLTTRSTGYKVLATDWNAVIDGVNRVNSGTTSVGRPAVMASDTATSNVSNATWTLMTFASEEYDTQGFHSTSTNTGRLTVNYSEAGLYQVHGMVTLDYSTSGKTVSIQVRKNAAGSSTGGTLLAQATTMLSDNSLVITAATINTMVRLASNDYVELFVFQNSGGALARKGTDLAHRFGMLWLTS